MIAGATGLWTAHTYRASLQETVVTSAERSADLIQRSARRAMLENSREDLSFLVNSLGGQDGAGRVRIGDPQGRIAFSSEPSEIGGVTHLDPARVQYFMDGKAPKLALTRPIRNEPECYNAACHAHPATQSVLGVLDVEMPLDRVENAMMAFERKSALVGAFGVLMIGVLALPIIRMQLAASRRESVRFTQELQRRVEEKADELTRAYTQANNVEKLASLGTLSAALAHEINNPLAGIRTYARWLSRTMSSTVAADPRAEEWKQALDVIEHESKRCGDLVRNLLTFARQTPLEMGANNVNEIVERCLLLVRHQAQMQNVEVTWKTSPGLPEVVCDGAQLQQALLAILINGIEVMPKGGLLNIGASQANDELRIEISDNGPGISAEALPHLFEPFFTTKQNGKGTGLGLSLAHGIISRHRGRIEVEPGLGRGAKFTVILPVEKSEGVSSCQKTDMETGMGTGTSPEASSLSTTNR